MFIHTMENIYTYIIKSITQPIDNMIGLKDELHRLHFITILTAQQSEIMHKENANCFGNTQF